MESVEPLLQELDEQWQEHLVPDLRSLLMRAASSMAANSAEACAELCAADLEWRWRVYRGEAPSPGSSAAVGLPERPSAREYRGLLGRYWESDDCRMRLLSAEWIARSVWGDQPHIDQFCRSSGAPMSHAQLLADQLQLISPLVVTVSGSERGQLECEVSSEFTVGRQLGNEPPPPAWQAEERRLVMASSDHRCFSREQLGVRRTRTREIEIINHSQKVALRLELGLLMPGQAIGLLLPFHLRVQDLELTVSVAGPCP